MCESVLLCLLQNKDAKIKFHSEYMLCEMIFEWYNINSVKCSSYSGYEVILKNLLKYINWNILNLNKIHKNIIDLYINSSLLNNKCFNDIIKIGKENREDKNVTFCNRYYEGINVPVTGDLYRILYDLSKDDNVVECGATVEHSMFYTTGIYIYIIILLFILFIFYFFFYFSFFTISLIFFSLSLTFSASLFLIYSISFSIIPSLLYIFIIVIQSDKQSIDIFTSLLSIHHLFKFSLSLTLKESIIFSHYVNKFKQFKEITTLSIWDSNLRENNIIEHLIDIFNDLKYLETINLYNNIITKDDMNIIFELLFKKTMKSYWIRSIYNDYIFVLFL